MLVVTTWFWLLLAPMPWGIALNHETRECGGFWSGDEYAGYSLPEGWVAYYPRKGVIETEIGSCTFPETSGFESPNPARAEDAEACCEELGYTYAGTPIGKHRISILMWGPALVIAVAGCLICLVVIAVLSLIFGGVVLLVRWRRRRRRAGGT
jgi:hypothetical protein